MQITVRHLELSSARAASGWVSPTSADTHAVFPFPVVIPFQDGSEAPASQPPCQVTSAMPSVIRAHAIITLGKYK